jgi:hypothetical protein
MKIFVTGGLGFVGSHLCRALLQSGHEITAVGRRKNPGNMIHHPSLKYLSADTTIPGKWQRELADHQVVVNLAGKSIFTLWTEKARKAIHDSRILTTRNLAEGLADRSDGILLSTSAIGYYGDRGDDLLEEQEPPGSDFLALVSRDWEREALAATASGNRVALDAIRYRSRSPRRGDGFYDSGLQTFSRWSPGKWQAVVPVDSCGRSCCRLSFRHGSPRAFRASELLCSTTGAQYRPDQDAGTQTEPAGYAARTILDDEGSAWKIRANPA